MLGHASIQHLKLNRKYGLALDLSLRGHSACVSREEQTIHLLKSNTARYR
jgi:hypothetical protein